MKKQLKENKFLIGINLYNKEGSRNVNLDLVKINVDFK